MNEFEKLPSHDTEQIASYAVLEALKDKGAVVVESRYGYGNLYVTIEYLEMIIALTIKAIDPSIEQKFVLEEFEDPYGEIVKENCVGIENFNS